MVGVLSMVLDALPWKLGEYEVLSDVRFLQVELGRMRATIRDLESLDELSDIISESYRYAAEEGCAQWVDGLRELAYDIDDWVDLFALRVHAGGGGTKPSFSGLLRWLKREGHKLTTLPASHDIATELQDIKERAIELSEQRKLSEQRELKELQELLKLVPELRVRRERYAMGAVDLPSMPRTIDPGDLVVGLYGPIEEVAKMVDAGDKTELKIVSIVGIAGSGKTTLANAVYRRLEENLSFQCRAFVSLGRDPDLSEILLAMLLMLGGMNRRGEDINQIISRIREILSNKRYLIVVDDLCNIEHWETIRCCFPTNDLSSRVLMTTRKAGLTDYFSPGSSNQVYKIGLLSDLDAKNVFLKRVFGTLHGCPSELVDISNKIIKLCAGLPLSLVIMASMLAHKPLLQYEWEKIALALARTSHADGLKQALNFSYNDLMPHLRTCMLYLSIFPEYYKIEVERLVILWIAEGFIAAAGGVSVEETARSYLNELISRSIVQPLHLSHDGVPRNCEIHPVIHDFIVHKSREENFVTCLMDARDHQYGRNNNVTVRRLSLHSSSKQGEQAMVRYESTDLSRARSITVVGKAGATPNLGDLKVVRVLDLQGCDGPVYLHGLSKLILLRHLSLRGTDVTELPATIGELKCLQILDVRSTKLKELPPSIGALLYLRYLNLGDTNVSELPTTIGDLRCLETLDARSTKVKELPHSIVKLKHTLKALLVSSEGTINLIETSTRMPEGIQNSQSLEKLGIIDLRGQHASYVKAFGGLNSLRVLKITWSSEQSNEEAYREALVSCITNWAQLESLTIHCGFVCSMEFLGSLPNPPRRLKKFKVTAGRFAVIPQWIPGLRLLSFMQITVCKLGSDDLRILEDLTRLKCLILGLEFIPRAAIVIGNEGFKELTRFSIDCPVPWLTFRIGAMPKLTYLELKFCSGPAGPESVPSGISNLRSLTEVVLCYNQKWCANSSGVRMTVDAVREEVARHYYPIELVINGTRVYVQQAEEAKEAAFGLGFGFFQLLAQYFYLTINLSYNTLASLAQYFYLTTNLSASSFKICRTEPEFPDEAERGGEAKNDVEVAGEGTSRIISSEIEEIEDDAEHGL